MKKFLKKMKKSLLLLSVCLFTAFVANAILVPVGLEGKVCLNGGIFEKENMRPLNGPYGPVYKGHCVCAPGWFGDRCEIPYED